MANPRNVLAQALSALEILHGDNSGIFEVRILKTLKSGKGKAIWHGYFNDVDLAYTALCDFNEDWSGAYVTINPVVAERFSVAPNKLVSSMDVKNAGAGDDHITHRQWLIIDVDPYRWPKEQPSNDEEHNYAIEVAKNISRFCQLRGMPEPILADSGNGAHLLWKCNLPNESNAHKRMLIQLASKFNSEKVDIDLVIDNPSRIWKIYGTLTRKGKSSQERMFRFAKILSVPSGGGIDGVNSTFVNENQITNWLPLLGEESVVKRYGIDGPGTVKIYRNPYSKPDDGEKSEKKPKSGKKSDTFDPVGKIREWGFETYPAKIKDGVEVHELKECPCPRKLKDRSSSVYLLDNGAAGFSCHHDTCEYSKSEGNQWKKLRDNFEPKPLLMEKETATVTARVSVEKLLEAARNSGGNKDKNKNKVEVFSDDLDALGPSIFDEEALLGIGNGGGRSNERVHIPTVVADDDNDGIEFDGILGDLANNDYSPVMGNHGEVGSAPDVQISRPANPGSKNIIRSHDGRRVVNIKADYLGMYNEVFEEIVVKPDIYTSQGKLSYVDTEKGSMTPYEDSGLDRLAWRLCEFVELKRTQNGLVTKPSPVPKRIIESLNALDHKDRELLREVEQVVKSPFFTRNGSFIVEPGYDKESKTYMIESPELPVIGSVGEALSYLKSIISDFPFQSDFERANFLGTWLTPMVRSMITGPVPMTIIEANKRGTGKTKLAQVVQLTYGLNPEVGDLPKEEQDMEKLMLSIIIEGRPIHLFDNVKHNVTSACLDRILTTGYYSGRLLGKTKNLHMAVMQLFIMTSNNTRMSDDMSRRFARVRLKTNLRNPERRADVRNPNLLPWITANRGRILACLAKLVTSWLEAGKPCPKNIPLLGSYESWGHVVGAIMFHVGETGWLGNLDEAMKDALVLDEWDTFAGVWYNEIGTRANINRLVDLCAKHGIMGNIVRGNDEGQKRFLLKQALMDRRDSFMGDFHLVVEKDPQYHTPVYILRKINAVVSDTATEDVFSKSDVKDASDVADVYDEPIF